MISGGSQTANSEPTEDESQVPVFCYDRPWTVAVIREKLKQATGAERDRLIAWILREAPYKEVWRYVTPEDVAECLPRVESQLGRWREFWKYTIGMWRELGKI